MGGWSKTRHGKKKQAGRPPAGRDEQGRPVPVSTTYKQTTVRLRPSTKAALDALALLREQDRSTIVEEALEAMIAQLPAPDREMVERLRRRRSSVSKPAQ